MHTFPLLKLYNTGIEDQGLKVGDKIPEFTLGDAHGKMVSSNKKLNEGPLVINFYRGAWCPYCNLELAAYQKILPEIQALGAQLIAISPNKPDDSLSSIEKHNLSFDVLSDMQNKVSKEFGLVFSLDERLRPIYEEFGINIPQMNEDKSYELPLPSTYVVDKEGLIVYAYSPSDYLKRAEPSEVLAALKLLR